MNCDCKDKIIEWKPLTQHPGLEAAALFSDGTADYRIPTEPKVGEPVRIRFRTAESNVDKVYLCHGEECMEMPLVEYTTGFDYYEITVTPQEARYAYRFMIESDGYRGYYDKVGLATNPRPQYDFEVVPEFSTPDWAKGAVMYQIFIDRFRNGDPSNDVKDGEYYYINRLTQKVQNWDKCPADFDVANFYGGDIAGVWEKLDYLQELGVEVLYFNPLFVSASSHKYDTQDYDYIDPHLSKIIEDGGEVLAQGESDNKKATLFQNRVTNLKNLEASNAYFAAFVQELHRRGMKIILDGVFNHCGSFNKWLDREGIYKDKEGFAVGAYHQADSPYHNYFSFRDEKAFPQNESYDGWWGHDTLPKLNYEGSRELEDYIIEVGKKWISEPYCIDGWRLDVAADLGHSKEYNHQFWRRFRQEMKAVNPDVLILAEHYGDPKDWLQGDQWDTVMNYDAFMEPVSWFLTGMEKHSEDYKEFKLGKIDSFCDSMNHYTASFQTPSLLCAMNQLSNHDHSRFLTRTNHTVGRACALGAKCASDNVKKSVMKAAVVIQMTWPGAPTLYYGDEVGVCGFTDPDNRRTYPWGNEDEELLDFHKDMIAIHRNSQALKTGSIKFLHGEQNLLCYGRFNRKEQFVVIINNDQYAHTVDLDVWPLGIPDDAVLMQMMYVTENAHSTAPVKYPIENGVLNISLPKSSSVVLRYVAAEDEKEEA